MSDLRKKFVMGGLAAGAALAVASSAAYACVPFKGSLQVNVSGNGTKQNSGTVVGDGSASNHRYCGNTGSNPGVTTAAEAQANGGNAITVSVTAATGTCSNQLLEATNYSVILNNPTVDSASPFTLLGGGSWSFRNSTGCFFSGGIPNGNKTLNNGSFAVDASGVGSQVITLPALNRADGTDQASGLCVGKGGAGGQGIFVPVKILNPAVI